jgi:hypothetical protein
MLMIASFAAIIAATASHAETLAEFRATVTGREVAIVGHIGTGLDMMDDEALHFVDAEDVAYPVIFDAGRDARRGLEGCKFALFGGGTPCAIEGMAEIELDGSRLRLIIYDVARLDAPTERR